MLDTPSIIISKHLTSLILELQAGYDKGLLVAEDIWKAVSDVGLEQEFENWFYDELQRQQN